MPAITGFAKGFDVIFMRLEWTLAWRFSTGTKQERSLSFLAGMTMVGCALGVACLIIALALMSGYERSLLRVMSKALPHLQIDSARLTPPKPATIRKALAKHAAVENIGLYASGRILIKAAHASSRGQVRAVLLQGVRFNAKATNVEAVRLAELVYVPPQPTNPTPRHLRALQTVARLQPNTTKPLPYEAILISRRLGRLLGVKVNQNLSAFRPPNPKEGFRLLPLGRPLRVVGWLETGIPAFDELIAIANIRTLSTLFTHQPATLSLGVWLKQPLKASLAATRLREAFYQQEKNFQVSSWLASNQRLFHVLAFQKKLLWVVLLLIVGLAFFGTSAGLFVLAQNKQHELAILCTMGLTKRMLYKVVFWQGMVLGGAGIMLGVGFGCFGVWLLAHFSNAWIPHGIYPGAGGAPLWLNPTEVAGVVLASWCICLIAARPVAKRIAAQSPVDALRDQH